MEVHEVHESLSPALKTHNESNCASRNAKAWATTLLNINLLNHESQESKLQKNPNLQGELRLHGPHVPKRTNGL